MLPLPRVGGALSGALKGSIVAAATRVKPADSAHHLGDWSFPLCRERLRDLQHDRLSIRVRSVRQN
jgi:hypothetical protein